MCRRPFSKHLFRPCAQSDFSFSKSFFILFKHFLKSIIGFDRFPVSQHKRLLKTYLLPQRLPSDRPESLRVHRDRASETVESPREAAPAISTPPPSPGCLVRTFGSTGGALRLGRRNAGAVAIVSLFDRSERSHQRWRSQEHHPTHNGLRPTLWCNDTRLWQCLW